MSFAEASSKDALPLQMVEPIRIEEEDPVVSAGVDTIRKHSSAGNDFKSVGLKSYESDTAPASFSTKDNGDDVDKSKPTLAEKMKNIIDELDL